MSFNLGSAHGTIAVDADLRGLQSFKKGLQDLQKQSNTTSEAVKRNFEAVGKQLTSLGRNLTLGVTTPFVAGVALSIRAASDLNEAITATEQIFGSASAQILEFSQTSAQALGLSRTAALSAAVGLAGMGQAAGLAEGDLADFSQQLLANASDLASFFNQDPTEMLDRLRSGLAGEAEPLRRFGILISEARVQQEALRLGLADSTGAISDQAKILARYSIIQQDMGAAQGDFARTSQGLANQMRILRAEFANASAELGAQLIPFALEAVKVLRGLIGAFADLPPEVQKVALALGAFAAVLGPLLLVAGAVASAITAIGVASAAAGLSMAVLLGALGPLALILGGAAALGLIAKHIHDTGEASDAARDPVDTLTESLRLLGETADDATAKIAMQNIITGFEAAAAKARQARDDAASAVAALSDPALGSVGGLGTTPDMANQIAEQTRALEEQRDAADRMALSDAELRDAEEDLNHIYNSQAADRSQLLVQAQHVIDDFLKPEGIAASELVTQLDNLAIASDGVRVGQAAVTAAGEDTAKSLAEVRQEAEDTNAAVRTYAALTAGQNPYWANQLQDIREVRIGIQGAARDAEDFARVQSALASGVGLGAGMPATGAFFDAADTREAARLLAEQEQEKKESLERVKQAEREYADEVKRINQDLQDTLRDLNRQREQNTRDMHRALTELERSTAQQIRQIEGQRQQAIATANDQLTAVAEQRAEVEQNLQEGLSDAQEAAAKQFADIAERRVEIAQNAAEQIADAEEQAAERIADIAERRKDIEEQTAESLADSREQAAEALADLASQQVEIQDRLRDSLMEAQQQYNDTLKDIAEAQAEVRQNLAEQLNDLADAWRQQERDFAAQAKEIRADLRGSLREMRAEWNKINQENLRQQQALRGEMQDTLAQNALTATQLQEDLARMQADPTFTAGEKEDAAFRTARALEGLALDREIAERDAARKIADLEAERRDQQKQYETERQNAVEQAQRDLKELNRARMEAEQAYHDRRTELEADAQEKIAALNDQRREAAAQLSESELDARKQAADAMQALDEQRSQVIEDQAKREADIREQAAEQMVDLAEQQVEIEQDLADRRQEIRDATNKQLVELAKQEGEVAQNLADTEARLREDAAEDIQNLADREAEIRTGLNTRLKELDHEREIAMRDHNRERGVILREAKNEAEGIAKEEADAEVLAMKGGLEAERTLRKTMHTEDLVTAQEQGKETGDVTAQGIIDGLNEKQPEVEAAGKAIGQAVITGANQSLTDLEETGRMMADSLIKGLATGAQRAQEAGKKVAGAAETGVKKQAKISSPSKVWDALGFNMASSMAAGHLRAAKLVEDAARGNVRRAAEAASQEFKKRRQRDGSWATVADQAKTHEQRGMLMARDGRMASLRSRPLHVTLELEGRVLDERIIDVGVGGLHQALQRNPLHRRR